MLITTARGLNSPNLTKCYDFVCEVRTAILKIAIVRLNERDCCSNLSRTVELCLMQVNLKYFIERLIIVMLTSQTSSGTRSPQKPTEEKALFIPIFLSIVTHLFYHVKQPLYRSNPRREAKWARAFEEGNESGSVEAAKRKGSVGDCSWSAPIKLSCYLQYLPASDVTDGKKPEIDSRRRVEKGLFLKG